MPSDPSSQALPPRRNAEMLFLIGHGLQSPLSAIRWGCSRLSKMAKTSMPKEQQHILEGIQSQSKILSGMLSSLLLVARVEDGTYPARLQEIFLHDFLLSFVPLQELFPASVPFITCPKDLKLHADRGVLEALLQAVIVILGTAATTEKVLHLTVTERGDMCSIDFLPEIELSFLRDMSDFDAPQSTRQLVGGAPGLMLSIVHSLSSFLGGRIDVEKRGKDHHVLSLTLPLMKTAARKKTAVSRSR